MRVLLSAYACEPDRGSEPEVGWQRALHMLALADEVWVLTRLNNREVIETNPLSHTPGLHFIYYDLPGWALKLKRQTRFLSLYYALWQWGAYRLAAKYHHDKPFDVVYHVTFASMKFGSFMRRLGIPFVIGPIAGGERAPLRLRRGIPIFGKVRELVRDMGILLQRYSPLIRPSFSAAKRIFVTTTESLRLIPFKWHSKTTVHLAVAIHVRTTYRDMKMLPDYPRFVYAGKLLYFKGVHLAIRALAEARRTIPDATLTIVGDGSAEGWLRNLASQCGVSQAVAFEGHIPRQQLINSFSRYTALVFPSFHDSGAMAVLEALSQGLPVVCLDLGGPGIIVNETCGIVIHTTNADEVQIVTGIANSMVSLGTMPVTEIERLSKGATARANELSWTNLTACIASGVNQVLPV
jgi:glycosyltransferase involved in cell wall biosynthesis